MKKLGMICALIMGAMFTSANNTNSDTRHMVYYMANDMCYHKNVACAKESCTTIGENQEKVYMQIQSGAEYLHMHKCPKCFGL